MFWSILAVSTHVFLFMLVFFVSSDCYQIFDENSCYYCHIGDPDGTVKSLYKDG